MAPRSTRSKPAATAEPVPATSSAPKLEASDTNPPHIFLLPKGASKHARFVTLLNPATESLERYLYCPTTGIYELKKIPAASNGTSRSLLLASKQQASAYVLKDAYILTALKIDPLVLLLPLFSTAATQSTGMARTEEDHFDTLAKTSSHMAALLRRQEFRALIRPRLAAVSEMADAMGEEAYRLQTGRLCEELRRRLDRMVEPAAWPASLEEQHVRKPLEAPAMPFRQTAMSVEKADQPSTSTNDKAYANESLVATEEVRQQARLKTALELLLHSYVPRTLHSIIRNHLTSNAGEGSKLKALDFTKLDTHLASIAKVRAENQALRAMSDNISRKRTTADDDEAAEIRAEKRRRKEEEELKKKNESRAVKQLKKVDTSGMKKLSSFFGAKTTAAK